MISGFTRILQDLVERTPGASAAIFAAQDGESVDHFAPSHTDEQVRLSGAHFGVLLRLIQKCLNLFHFGEAERIHVTHERMEVLLRPVAEGYFVCMTMRPGAHLATAIRELDRSVDRIRNEM